MQGAIQVSVCGQVGNPYGGAARYKNSVATQSCHPTIYLFILLTVKTHASKKVLLLVKSL